jgi:hypothetical protein
VSECGASAGAADPVPQGVSGLFQMPICIQARPMRRVTKELKRSRQPDWERAVWVSGEMIHEMREKVHAIAGGSAALLGDGAHLVGNSYDAIGSLDTLKRTSFPKLVTPGGIIPYSKRSAMLSSAT